ncbi:MAG: TrpR YerC/YecD [Lachnospiraceae bacterium]|nr:TrpR YerC/YecD [Lachnospiraceae bacterium]MBQ6196078.1 TrpR YerC/YecD [Lachnospiraceae bacterium]
MKELMQSEPVRELIRAILTLETEEEVEQYLLDVCTINEIATLAQRQQVAFLLRDKMTYNEIEEKTGASTATISRVKRSLLQGGEGYEAARKRLKGE